MRWTRRIAFPTPMNARVEVVTSRRTISDGGRTVELIDVRPNPHTDEMLVAYVAGNMR